LRIKDADAGDEFIRVTTHPFADSRLVSNLIFDIYDRLGRSNAGYNVSKNLLLPTCTARLLEDSDVAGLPRTVVAVDNGKAGRELECLIFRERVDTLVMKYRIERYRRYRPISIRYMLLGKRFDLYLFDQPVIALAYFSQLADVVVGEFSIHD
jgi:hypothetical protein